MATAERIPAALPDAERRLTRAWFRTSVECNDPARSLRSYDVFIANTRPGSEDRARAIYVRFLLVAHFGFREAWQLHGGELTPTSG